MNTRATPFLKWAGGKTQLLPALLQHVPSTYDQYIEPFVGGGALFFRLQPAKAVLADSNPELINCYIAVRDQVAELVRRLGEYERLHSREFYYSIRMDTGGDELERAARFIYLNKTCYNGLYRVNKQGQFNVPFGKYAHPYICEAEKLRAASQALQNTELVCADYKDTLEGYAKPGDFVYLDPPYHPVSKYSDFKRYTTEFFYSRDQRELAQTVKQLRQHGCNVLVSNSFCDFVLELYDGLEIVETSARRNINKDPAKRARVKEVIVVCN